MIVSVVYSVRNWISIVLAVGLFAGSLFGGNYAQSSAQPAPPAHSSVSLTPAVVMVRCSFGQSYTQGLTLTNLTDQEFTFEMAAQDVVVRDGKRILVLAGETQGGIAATAVFSRKQVVVPPGESVTVGVTFTVPPETPVRGAIAVFRGLNKVSIDGPVKMTASLGALFTFTVSGNVEITGSPLEVTAQSPTANLRITQSLTNTGSEPLVAHGVAAVLNESGTLVGKTPFEDKRLLPGEQLAFEAVYPSELKTGHYRVLASFQYEKKVLTNSTDFVVQ
jgi:hypothetical protein